jgi:cell division protein FtsB
VNESTESTPRRSSRRTRRTPGPGVSSRAGRLFRIGLVLLAAMLVVESLFGSRGLSAMFQARRDYSAAETDLERLRAENARLRAEATRLREDPTAIEEAARRDLGYIAPGEKLFIIHDARPAPTTPPVPTPK